MTVATEYFNYQQAPTTDPRYAKGPAPAMVDIKDYVLKRFGGMDLGIYGLRNIIGGTSKSTHSFGAAWDWRYENPGIGRTRMLNEVMPFLISNSQELGIQFIGDYRGCRIWKADRSGDMNGGWKIQPVSSQMGQSWASWLHIEIHPRVWADGRTVEEKLGIVGFPPFNPAQGQFSLYPLAQNKPTLKLGSQGDPVAYMQGVFKFKLGYGIAVDGAFGNITLSFVRWFQGSHGLQVDGIVGPRTWDAIDVIART